MHRCTTIPAIADSGAVRDTTHAAQPQLSRLARGTSMRYSRILSLSLCVAAVGLSLMARVASAYATASAGTNGPCRVPDGTTVAHLHYLRTSSISSDPEDSTWRMNTKVPSVVDTTGKIYVVSDSALCAQALAVFNSTVLRADSGATEIEVLRVDTVYVVSNPAIMSGEFIARRVFDSAFNQLSTYFYSKSEALPPPPPVGPITRTRLGLLFKDDFNRPNGPVGGDWATQSGIWQVGNGALSLFVNAGQDAVLRLAALNDRRDYHVQLLSSRSVLSNYASIHARVASNLMYLADMGSTMDGDANKPRLYRNNGAWYKLGIGTTASVANSSYRLTFSAIRDSITFWVDGNQQASAVDGVAGWDAPGHFELEAYGIGGAGMVTIDDVIICSGRAITVSGLPPGFKVRVAGLVSAPVGTDSTARLDLQGATLPAAQLDVLNASNVQVQTYAPSNGIWGGDAYAVNGTPEPPPSPGGPTIARTAAGLLFKDDFNRADEQLVGAGKSWTRMGSPSTDADWQVQTNQAKALSAGASATQTEVYPQTIAPQTGDVVVQAWFQRGNTSGRTGVTLVQAGEAGGVLFVRDPSHGWELWNYGSGFYTNPANSTSSTRENGVLKLRRANGRYQAWADGILIFDIPGDSRLNTVPFYPALLQLQQPAAWDDFAAYSGNVITISGLPVGYRLRVGTATSEPAALGQPTTVDAGGVSFPAAQIEILDMNGAVVKQYAPSDGVWGGDQYTYTP